MKPINTSIFDFPSLITGGYLTIDRRITDERVLLKIPNHEVRQSLEQGYISRLLGRDFELDRFQDTAEDSAAQLAEEGYTDAFRTMLQSAYSLLPHDRRRQVRTGGSLTGSRVRETIQ